MNKQRGVGILLIILGTLFLFGQFVNVGSLLWPFFVVVPGIVLLAWAFIGGRGAAGLAVPGSIVTTVGLILIFMNATGTFQAWSYAWALVVAAVGIGNYIQGTLVTDARRQRDGVRTVTAGLVMFAAFGIFFEFLVFGDMWGTWVGQWFLPLLLILGGALILYFQRRRGPAEVRREP